MPTQILKHAAAVNYLTANYIERLSRDDQARAWKDIHAHATLEAIPLRLAAFATAVERVDRAGRLSGYV